MKTNLKAFYLLFLLVSSFAFSQASSDTEISQENPNSWQAENDNPKPHFSFVKTVLAKMEKELQYSDYHNKEEKIIYSGARIVKSKEMRADNGQYIKLSSIPETEKFVVVCESSDSKMYLIRNAKTNQLYAIPSFSINYVDYSPSGMKNLIKIYPIPLTQTEQELLTRYKLILTKGNANVNVLLGIQKKCLTRGFFDPSKMNATDKKSYNKNLSALQLRADEIADIRKYEDKEKNVQDRLTLTELGQISNIMDWARNQKLD